MKRIAVFVLYCLPVATLGGQAELTIPKGTEIFLTLGTEINSKTSQPADAFFGTVAVPVVVDDQILIPVGSHIFGKVSQVERKKKRGWVGLAFESVMLPSGATYRIEAGMGSPEGENPDPDTGKKDPFGIGDMAERGIDALIGLFDKKAKTLPKDSTITIHVSRDTQLVQKKD